LPEIEDRQLPTDAACSLQTWAETVLDMAGQVPARHHRLLIEKLELVSNGEIDRLMVQMPPGSAKSTYSSILLPGWWLMRHPKHSIIAASHTAALATYFGRRARAVVSESAETLGYTISPECRSNGQWATSFGGEYYAVGVKGGVVGRRADLAIIDDPVRSQYEADSALHRDRVWDWFRSDLVPRMKPKGRIVLVMTRWHEDDLCGRLLAQEPDRWHCIRLPALAEEGDPLGRAPNEPLWPEWEDLDALMRRRETIGERAWQAQYQQSPTFTGSALFKTECLEFVDSFRTQPGDYAVRGWDLAATSTETGPQADWTVGLKLVRDERGRFTILDVVRSRGTPRGVEDIIEATARADGRQVAIGLPQDPGQAGKSQVAYLSRSLAGYRVSWSPETGSKMTRAGPVASQIEAGNIALVRADWNQAFIEELRNFPYGRKDDQVDALCRAFMMTLEAPSQLTRRDIPHMVR
jgi:predicted phage terminase large subunit-like protein